MLRQIDDFRPYTAEQIAFLNRGKGIDAPNLQAAVEEIYKRNTLDIVNVKDFGAVGDGATDDYEAIQNALDSVGNAGGGEVYFPKGTYLTSKTLRIHSNTSIRGAGASSQIMPYPSHSFDDIPLRADNTEPRFVATPIITTLSASQTVPSPTKTRNISISDICIQWGDTETDVFKANIALLISDAENVTVDRLFSPNNVPANFPKTFDEFIENVPHGRGSAITVIRSNGVVIKNSLLGPGTYEALGLRYGAVNVTVDSCTVYASPFAHAIEVVGGHGGVPYGVEQSNRVRITNNHITIGDKHSTDGISLHGPNRVIVANNVVKILPTATVVETCFKAFDGASDVVFDSNIIDGLESNQKHPFRGITADDGHTATHRPVERIVISNNILQLTYSNVESENPTGRYPNKSNTTVLGALTPSVGTKDVKVIGNSIFIDGFPDLPLNVIAFGELEGGVIKDNTIEMINGPSEIVGDDTSPAAIKLFGRTRSTIDPPNYRLGQPSKTIVSNNILINQTPVRKIVYDDTAGNIVEDNLGF